MTIRVTTEDSGLYALIEMHHPPDVGPALHVHPRGPEAFYIVEGAYTFYRDSEVIHAGPGKSVVIPAGVAHRYRSGPAGGRALVISPPDLERYFWEVAERLRVGVLPLDEEFAIATANGQDFLERAGHWDRTGGPDAPAA
ncbi:MAG: cupin domain-containing protein [bacterium]